MQKDDMLGCRGMVGLSPPTVLVVLVNEEVKTELWKLSEDAVGEFRL